MDWKNQLAKTPYLVLFIVLISVGVGTASALITITLSGNVIITDDLLVEGKTDVTGGAIISHRNDGFNTANLIIERPGGPTADNAQFVFSQRSNDKDLWLYGFNGTTFKNFVGFDFPNYKIIFPATSNTLVVDAANDKVGVGTTNPTSELHVVGDVTIDGEITCTDCIDSPELEQFGSGRTLDSVEDPLIGDCLIGEVVLFAGNYAHKGFLPAQGQIVSIIQYQTLFSILGTTFGGDGRSDFGLPDLRNTEPNSTFFGNNDDVNYLICVDGFFPSRP